MKKKIIKDSLFLVVANFIIKFKGLISIPIMVRYIGLENYGAYTQILANISLIAPFCQFAIGQGFYRYTSIYDCTEKEKIGRDYWSVLTFAMLLSLCGALGIYCSSSLISDKILGGLSLDSVRLSSLLVFSAVLYSVNSKFIQSRKYFALYSVFQVVYSLVPYLAMIVGIVWHSSLFVGLVLYLIAEVVLNVFMFIYIVSRNGVHTPSFARVKKFLKFTAPLTASSFSGSLLSKLDRYFIGYFCGAQSIGVYSIVYSLCSILDQFSVPFTKYFQIYLPKMWEEKKESEVKSQLRRGLKFYLVVTVGSVFLLAFIVKPLLLYLLNKDLSQIVHFESLTIVLGLGVVCLGVSRFFYHLTLYREKTHLQLYVQLVGVLVNCILNYFLIKEFAIIGAAISTLISYMVIVVLCQHVLDMGLGWDFVLNTILILVSGIMIVTVFMFNTQTSILEIFFKSIFAGSLYVLMLFLFKIITFTEIKWSFRNI